jgi:hypothetical protein
MYAASAQCLVLSTLVGTGVAATWLASGYDTIRYDGSMLLLVLVLVSL